MKLLTITWLLITAALTVPVRAQQQQASMRDYYYKDLVQFSGAVVTGDSLHPVPFAHITDESTGYWTICDLYGYFSFVARKGDTINFSAVGFKKVNFRIPDTIQSNRYAMFQVMVTDTIYLPTTMIYAWPTKEEFKHAFVTADIPDDDIEIARKNLERYDFAIGVEQVPMDASMNYRNYIDQTVSKLYYAGQTQPITLLNPFAWAQFIKAWQDGKFKRKKK